MRADPVYLGYIAESIGLIEQYLTGADGTLSRDAIHKDRRTQDAVLRRMETLADAASRLSNELKARHPELHWRQD